jgi:hypothetical protein
MQLRVASGKATGQRKQLAATQFGFEFDSYKVDEILLVFM